jgi:hypothetical protein
VLGADAGLSKCKLAGLRIVGSVLQVGRLLLRENLHKNINIIGTKSSNPQLLNPY